MMTRISIIGTVVLSLLLSWPSDVLAQKVISEQNRETNGAEKSSSQSKTSANYSVLRDRTEMSHVRSKANATSNGLGKQVEKKVQEAKANQERERVRKEQEDRKNSGSDKKESGSDKKDADSDKKKTN